VQSTAKPSSSTAVSAPAGSAASSASVEPPESVIARFLEALRAGDENAVAGLLTNAARQETVRLGYQINPPGDPTSTYQVGRIEYSGEQQNEALASSVWTHDLGDGEMFSFEAVWILKRESEGWRVSGLAVSDPGNEQPLVFNFENLEEVFQKKDLVEQATADGAVQGTPMPNQATNTLPAEIGTGSLR
jgi:hypothetical protein